MNHSDNSSDSEEDDPFAFSQHKFKKVQDVHGSNNYHNHHSSIDNDSDDDESDDDSSQGSALFSSRSKRGKKNSLIRPTKKKPRQVGTANRYSTHANSSDDDDDSSTDEKENQTNRSSTSNQPTNNNGTTTHASKKKPMSSLTPVDAILLSSSSDEDDNIPSRQSFMHRTTRVRSAVATTTAAAAAPSECDTKTMNAIRQAKEAAYALRAAQAAKPTDYYDASQEKPLPEMDMEEDDNVLGSETHFTSSHAAATMSHGTEPQLASLGPTIRLSLRVMISEPNGGNAAGNNAKTIMGKIRMDEPLQRIVQDLTSGNISSMQSLTPRDKITFTFDGQSLNLKSTPRTHDMEDEDLVDVLVEKGKGTGVMTNITPNRPQLGGAATATAMAGNMLRSMNRPVVAAAAPSVVPATLVQIVTRVNGADATKQQFRLRSCDPLQKVVDAFCLKNHVVPSDCRFEFDGAILSPMSTPAQEDMEGDEIIDVRISPTKWTNRTTVNNNNNNNSTTGQSTSPASSLSRLSMTPSTPTVSRPSSSSSSNNTSKQIITIAVLRNNNVAETKCFRLWSTDSLAKLKKGYKKQWEKQGCRSVRFYFKNVLMSDEVSAFSVLGIGDRTEFVAIENNRSYNP